MSPFRIVSQRAITKRSKKITSDILSRSEIYRELNTSTNRRASLNKKFEQVDSHFCHNCMASDPENKYLIVEFRNETDGNEPTQMAVISSAWMIREGNATFCYWPDYIRSELQRVNSIIKHQELDMTRATKCPIKIKFSTKNYEDAVEKLKQLELFEEELKQTACKNQATYDEVSSDDDMPLVNSKGAPNDPLAMTSGGNFNSVPFFEKIIEQNEMQLQHLRQLTKLVENLLEPTTSFEKTEYEHITATTAEELQDFDHTLTDEDHMKNMITYFYTLGGKDSVQHTRRILNELLTNNVALGYNWAGRNGKNPFSELKNCIRLILFAVQKNPTNEKTTLEEIESTIKKWLRTAPDREGGRSMRGKKNIFKEEY